MPTRPSPSTSEINAARRGRHRFFMVAVCWAVVAMLIISMLSLAVTDTPTV